MTDTTQSRGRAVFCVHCAFGRSRYYDVNRGEVVHYKQSGGPACEHQDEETIIVLEWCERWGVSWSGDYEGRRARLRALTKAPLSD